MLKGRLRELNLAAPPQVLQVEVGDTCRVTSRFDYSGPAIPAGLYVAVGNAGFWGFNEILKNSKSISLPATSPAKTYEGYVDIYISSAISPGFYDVYAKLVGIPGPDMFSPTYENIIQIVEEAPPPPPPEYTLEVTIEPPGTGSVSISPSMAEYPAGTTVTLTASPYSGYEFDHWGGIPAISGTSPTKIITMDQDRWVVAVFRQIPAVGYTLEVRRYPRVGFEPSKDPDKPLYERNEVVIIMAYPPWGYEFNYWMVNGSKREYNPASVIMVKDTVAVAYYRSV